MSSTLSEPRTPEELRAQAEQEVSTELQGQVAPYEADRTQTQLDEQRALESLSKMFGSLVPGVQSSAGAVADSYQHAESASSAIFQAAQQQFNQLKQGRAAEAQKLAQQIGGPVDLGEFNDLMPQAMDLAGTAARSQLSNLAISQSGVELAQAFAGKVFPQLQVETTTSTRRQYEDRIKELSSHIDQLRSSKSGAVNSRFNDLLASEREYELHQSELALDRLKADRDWQATKQSLKQDQARLNLAKKEFHLSEAGTTGKYKGKPTLESKRLTLSKKELDVRVKQLNQHQRMEARRAGLSEREYALRVYKATESTKVQNRKLAMNRQENAMEILDHATNPNSGRPVTMSVRTPLTGLQAARAAAGRVSGAHHDPKTGQWYKYEKLTLTPQQWQQRGGYTGSVPITDPNKLYDLLIGASIPPKMALNLVRQKVGDKGFTPGARYGVSANDLSAMPFNELRGIAMQRGFQPDKKHPRTKQQLIDYILSTNRTPA